MFSVGRHDITFEKGGDNVQIDVIIKADNQEAILNDKATFDIVIVPEFSSSIPIAVVMTMAIVIAILWRGHLGRKFGN